jgi:hypothetical protein
VPRACDRCEALTKIRRCAQLPREVAEGWNSNLGLFFQTKAWEVAGMMLLPKYTL